MLWIWFSPVTTKKLLFKITAPKRQVKSLKTTCEVVSFYYICKLYTWNLWKTILSQAFLKGFAKIACDVKLYGTVRNLIIYFAETFQCLLMITISYIYYSFPFFSSPNVWGAFFQGNLPVIVSANTYLKKAPPKNL